MNVLNRRFAGVAAVLACLGFAVATAPAAAQSAGTPNANSGAGPAPGASVLDKIRERMRDAPDPSDKPKSWFEKLDTDRSGDISKQELFDSIRKQFDNLDRNRDGFVDKSEYRSGRRDGSTGESRFGQLDSNGDGRLDMPEFASPADWRFDRIDRNLDGKISQTEADRLFNRPEGKSETEEITECFYVDRQIIRVDEQTAESLKKKGFPKADCQWTPDTVEQDKSKQFTR